MSGTTSTGTSTSTFTILWSDHCDADFRTNYEAVITSWLNAHRTHNVEVGGRSNWIPEAVTFDQAVIMSGFHPTTSRWDPNTAEHATVRLSTATLRQTRSWYTLHWRLDDGSSVLPRPLDQATVDADRRTSKAKKQRQKKRTQIKKEQQKKEEDKKDEDSAAGTTVSQSGRAGRVK